MYTRSKEEEEEEDNSMGNRQEQQLPPLHSAVAIAIVLQSNQPKKKQREKIVQVVNNTELFEIEVHASFELNLVAFNFPIQVYICVCVYVWSMQWDSLCCVVYNIQALIRNWLHTIVVVVVVVAMSSVTVNYLLPLYFLFYWTPFHLFFQFSIFNSFNAILVSFFRAESWT